MTELYKNHSMRHVKGVGMFSGIVEAQVELLDYKEQDSIQRIILKKPSNFNDLKCGDSIAVNGVCLTVEAVSQESIQFAMGLETLKITGWSRATFEKTPTNLERSLNFSDRVHGHFVSGHVDGLVRAKSVQDIGGNRLLKLELQNPSLLSLIWKKGSVALNGVSLTINSVEGMTFEVGLIPETLKRTNLAMVSKDDYLTIEADPMARAMQRYFEVERLGREQNI